MDTWESKIALHVHEESPSFDVRMPIGAQIDLRGEHAHLREAVERDTYFLPNVVNREGYFQGNDLGYWLSGYEECEQIVEMGLVNSSYVLDLGGATGRAARHFALQHGLQVTVADLNYLHIRWLQKYLPVVNTMQLTSIPYLPASDGWFGLVTAFSVFTHIPCMEQAWLQEIKRVLQPGGHALLTVHTEKTYEAIDEEHYMFSHVAKHPDWEHGKRELTGDRKVYQYEDGSYKSHVFLHSDYIREAWGSIMEVVDIQHEGSFLHEGYVLLRNS